uniref:Actin-binding Rho-activating protein n=1 Tax=Neogobius melanostomus TaxID=47308 RepID=A0A8C6T5S9_9GOBI
LSAKTYTNKNIRKLRAVSRVCSLASSWQQWVTDNETKQANEPSGWAPSCLDDPKKDPQETQEPKKTAKTTAEDAKAIVEPPVAPPIKTKHVEKTVTSAAKEKSVGIGLLAEKITKETAPSNEEIDRLLKKTSSPTRRRKCSNMVSSLTKSWKQVEKTATDGTELKEGNGEEEETAVKIKRPTVSVFKKEAEDANKINALSKNYSAVGSLKSRWQSWASEHTVNQKLNPFSEYFDYDYSMSTRLQRGQEGYGRPKEGTKTAERAKRAEQHIHREIDDMCLVIRMMADPDRDGRTRVTFGELFDRYVRISDKVVGILMRARKHGKLEFEGEMLWQGRDDGVIITLLV